jgi:SAM-dependent methyltransferase
VANGTIPEMKTRKSCMGGLIRMTIAAVFATTVAMSISAQEFLAASGTPASAFPNPDRPVADIISPIWHDEKERDAAGEPRQLIRLLGVKSGMTVADIGAGSGYYVVRLSPVVGPRGRIIAEDVVPEYLQGLRKRVRDAGLQNVVISRGEPHDPRLPADSLDIAILVHMYHEIAQLTVCSTISFRRLSLTRGLALSTPLGRRPNMVHRQIFYAVSLRPWDIARSASIDSRAAMPIWRSLCHRLLRAGRRRKPWSRARRASARPSRANAAVN